MVVWSYEITCNALFCPECVLYSQLAAQLLLISFTHHSNPTFLWVRTLSYKGHISNLNRKEFIDGGGAGFRLSRTQVFELFSLFPSLPLFLLVVPVILLVLFSFTADRCAPRSRRIAEPSFFNSRREGREAVSLGFRIKSSQKGSCFHLDPVPVLGLWANYCDQGEGIFSAINFHPSTLEIILKFNYACIPPYLKDLAFPFCRQRNPVVFSFMSKVWCFPPLSLLEQKTKPLSASVSFIC